MFQTKQSREGKPPDQLTSQVFGISPLKPTNLNKVIKMAGRQQKSPFRPKSPDALSKLRKCKTRRERQLAFLSDQIEREERLGLEQAAIDAANNAAHLKVVAAEVAQFWDSNWLDDYYKLASVRPKTPKKPRKERADLTTTPEPKKQFNYASRIGMDPKKFHVSHGSGQLRGKLLISKPEHEQKLIPGAEVEGNFILSEKFILDQKLKE
jgi:hypothetical protein